MGEKPPHYRLDLTSISASERKNSRKSAIFTFKRLSVGF